MDKALEDQFKLAHTRFKSAVGILVSAGKRAGNREQTEAVKQGERLLHDISALAKGCCERITLCKEYLEKYLGTVRQGARFEPQLECLTETELEALLCFVPLASRQPSGKSKAELKKQLMDVLEGKTAVQTFEESFLADGFLEEVTVYCDTVGDRNAMERKVEEIGKILDKHGVPVDDEGGGPPPPPDEPMEVRRRRFVRQQLKDLPFVGGAKVFRLTVEQGKKKVHVAHTFL